MSHKKETRLVCGLNYVKLKMLNLHLKVRNCNFILLIMSLYTKRVHHGLHMHLHKSILRRCSGLLLFIVASIV